MNKEKVSFNALRFRPITDNDIGFLYNVYASTRAEEMANTGWNQQQTGEFLSMQFNLQHTQYLQNYPAASFDIMLWDGVPIGRLYVDRREKEIRILDISLLPDFRGRGIGSKIMKDLIAEANEKKVPLNLHVLRNNPALTLYEKLGFKKVAENDFYFLMEIEPGNRRQAPDKL
ncbi:MAG: GNAT family N-acetyltransferase [bacterium]|nr:GNAT family N-acetyltransferase [bacterium]